MDFRSRRQLAVVLVVALIVAAIGIVVFWVNAPAPTCQDNRKNQSEEDVDCGGVCEPCAFRHQQALETIWVRFVGTRENSYDLAAEIHNPNLKLGGDFAYEFKLYDTAGVLVASRRGVSFIYPAETMHLAEVGLTSGRAIRSAALAIQGTRWGLTEATSPDIIAGNREYLVEESDGARRSIIKGIITNRTLERIPDISITALAFDEIGNLLGVHRTAVAELGAGNAEAVRFTWPNVFAESVSSIVIEARSPALLPSPMP